MAVDVGNTQTVLGLFEGAELRGLRGQRRITTEAQRTSDELAVVFAGLLDLDGLGLGRVGAMIVSSSPLASSPGSPARTGTSPRTCLRSRSIWIW